MLSNVASAFHANPETESSVKSRKFIHVSAIEVNASDRTSEVGGVFSDTTRNSAHNFSRCRVLRNMIDDVLSEGVDIGGSEKASREERNVAARTDFCSGVSLEAAWFRHRKPIFKSIGIARRSIVSFEVVRGCHRNHSVGGLLASGI